MKYIFNDKSRPIRWVANIPNIVAFAGVLLILLSFNSVCYARNHTRFDDTLSSGYNYSENSNNKYFNGQEKQKEIGVLERIYRILLFIGLVALTSVIKYLSSLFITSSKTKMISCLVWLVIILLFAHWAFFGN